MYCYVGGGQGEIELQFHVASNFDVLSILLLHGVGAMGLCHRFSWWESQATSGSSWPDDSCSSVCHWRLCGNFLGTFEGPQILRLWFQTPCLGCPGQSDPRPTWLWNSFADTGTGRHGLLSWMKNASTFNLKTRESKPLRRWKLSNFCFSTFGCPRFVEAFQTQGRGKSFHLSWYSWQKHHSPCSCTNYCRMHHLALAFERLPEDSHWSFGHRGCSLWSFLPRFSRAWSSCIVEGVSLCHLDRDVNRFPWW